MAEPTTPSEPRAIGLCRSCRHGRVVRTPRSTFWLCSLAATDPRFEKYPRLPVLRCAGYAPEEDAPPEAEA